MRQIFFELQASEKGLQLLVVKQEPLPQYISSDPLRLTQILTNLLGNAVKFTDEGSVTLEASVQGMLDEKAILKFSVRDTGKGIPKKSSTFFLILSHRSTVPSLASTEAPVLA